MDIQGELKELQEKFTLTVQDQICKVLDKKESWIKTCLHLYSERPLFDETEMKWEIGSNYVIVYGRRSSFPEDFDPMIQFLAYKGRAVAVSDERMIPRDDGAYAMRYYPYVPQGYERYCPLMVDNRATEEAWERKVSLLVDRPTP